MVRAAEPHDIWSASGQQWLEDQLNLVPGRNAFVQVAENRVHVSLHTGVGYAEWMCESGGEWTVDCPVHRSACLVPFAENGAEQVGDALETWAARHG